MRQIAEYGQGLSPEKNNPEESVEDLVKFLPVLAYDGANMIRVDAGGILDIALAGHQQHCWQKNGNLQY